MKFNISSPDASYASAFFFIRIPGYAFFTVRKIGNGMVEFCQTWLDYFIFILSVSSGAYAASGKAIKVFDVKMKSTILRIGLFVFWELSIISMVVTKLNNFLCARTCFKILIYFRWMDKVVGLTRRKFNSRVTNNLNNNLQFSRMEISGHPRKLFFITVTVFFGYYGIFAANVVANYLSFAMFDEKRTRMQYIIRALLAVA